MEDFFQAKFWNNHSKDKLFRGKKRQNYRFHMVWVRVQKTDAVGNRVQAGLCSHFWLRRHFQPGALAARSARTGLLFPQIATPFDFWAENTSCTILYPSTLFPPPKNVAVMGWHAYTHACIRAPTRAPTALPCARFSRLATLPSGQSAALCLVITCRGDGMRSRRRRASSSTVQTVSRLALWTTAECFHSAGESQQDGNFPFAEECRATLGNMSKVPASLCWWLTVISSGFTELTSVYIFK